MGFRTLNYCVEIIVSGVCVINPISQNLNRNSANFSGEDTTAPKKKIRYEHDTLLKNNPLTNFRISLDKVSNAATVYTAKGLTGNKNSNFYEFLTLGIIPYVAGGITMMSVFNSANKHFDAFSKNKAKKYGNKMALGVIFYALAKELSKPLITLPVKLKTGVDVNQPYARVIYELPESKNDTDITSVEYHKVFESVEFPRWDLLYKDEAKGEKRNAYYDKIAKKNGYGENLKDSDQEMKPRISEIATKTITAKNIVPYLWAGTGVALAMQKPWENFFPNATLKFWKINDMKDCVNSFGRCLKKSAKELYFGGKDASKAVKIAGKLSIFVPLAATILADANIMHNSHKITKNTKQENLINKNRKYTTA